jgi:hypothetical protein
MGLLEILIIVLVVLWLGGMGTGYVFGGALHILLVILVIVVILRLVQGRSAL